jgi:hypothetical protein
VLDLCEKRIFLPGPGIYVNDYWAVWENGTGCESVYTTYIVSGTQSGQQSAGATQNQCNRFSDSGSYDQNAPNTCGFGAAQFYFKPPVGDVVFHTWNAPSSGYQCP